MPPQFDESCNSGNREHGSSGMSPGEISGVVIAALTLLVAMTPLFRWLRFRRWMSSSISPFVEVYPPLPLPKPIHIYILNIVILYRKLPVLLLQNLCRPLLPPQRTQMLSKLLRFLHLALSSFTVIISTWILLAPVLIPSQTIKMASPKKKVEYYE